MQAFAGKPVVVLIAAACLGGCSGTTPEDPTFTPVYDTQPPLIEATIEGEAWDGVLEYDEEDPAGPDGGDIRFTAYVYVQIFKFDKGLFCGYGYRELLTAEKYNLSQEEWVDQMSSVAVQNLGVTNDGRIAGTAKRNTETNRIDLCGHFTVPGEPEDPDVGPYLGDLGCDDDPLVTGYLDLGETYPNAVLFHADVKSFGAVGHSINIDPTDLYNTTLGGESESTWCGDWLPSSVTSYAP